MKTSNTIVNIGTALLKAQKVMGGAKKGASNPYFKSKYADLGSVLEASKELLNENGIVILQPHSANERGNYVETILLHESGEWLSSETAVVCSKQNDPQALGSAITYARRYGLQSLLSMPAEDDDGEGAMKRESKTSGAGLTIPNSGNVTVTLTANGPNASGSTTEAPKKNSWRKAKTTAIVPDAPVAGDDNASGMEF